MTTLLIDGDLFCYQASSAAEHEVNWGDDLWTLHANATDAFKIVTEKLDELQDRFIAGELLIAFSSPDNFRKEVLPTYKGNRIKVRKPICYRPVVEFLTERYKTFLRPRLEADDILGILATSDIVKGDKVIVTEDKDLKQIPGLYHSPRAKETITVTDMEADRSFYLQALHGDQTDGYGGCPGIGPVKALKILEPFFTPEKVDHAGAWQAIVAAYAKAGLTEVDALTQARVARILRKEDYDFPNKKPILWSPLAS